MLYKSVPLGRGGVFESMFYNSYPHGPDVSGRKMAAERLRTRQNRNGNKGKQKVTGAFLPFVTPFELYPRFETT